jgi:hypothetical protein
MLPFVLAGTAMPAASTPTAKGKRKSRWGDPLTSDDHLVVSVISSFESPSKTTIADNIRKVKEQILEQQEVKISNINYFMFSYSTLTLASYFFFLFVDRCFFFLFCYSHIFFLSSTRQSCKSKRPPKHIQLYN